VVFLLINLAVNLFNISFQKIDNMYLVLFFTIIFSAISFKKINSIISKYIERFLLRNYSRIRTELNILKQKIITILDIREVANLVVNTLYEVFFIRNVSLYVYDEEAKTYFSISSAGLSVNHISRSSIDEDDSLIKHMHTKRGYISRDDFLTILSWQEASAISHSFEKLHANYIFPLIFEDELIAFLAISRKTSGNPLNKRELNHLNNFNKLLTLIISNAREYRKLQKKNDELMGIQSRVLQSAKISAIEKLASGIAHELHNPLTIISGKAQVLLLKGPQKIDNAYMEDVLKTIVTQTKRAAEITRQLLMFTKPQKEDSTTLINIENILNDTISLVSYKMSLDEIRIDKVIEGNVPLIEGSLFEVRELFLNLILNAIQAIGKKGVITIELKYINVQNIIKVCIADTGHGISEDMTANIFDPFYTTYSENVGLGLFVCQQIVKRLGGSIRVESKINEGSVFIISLPVIKREIKNQIYNQKNENKITDPKSIEHMFR